MAKEFKLPDPGEGIREAQVQEIRISEGDSVQDGDILLAVETDKADFEVPASFSGTIEKIHVEEGSQARVGDTIVSYRENDGSESVQSSSEEAEETGENADSGSEEDETGGDKEDAEGGKEEEEKEKEKEKDEDEDEDEEKASSKKEVKEAEDKQPSKEDSEAKEENTHEPSPAVVPASPSTRRLAQKLNVDLEEISPGGEEGRVTAEDVREYADSHKTGEEKKEEPDTDDFSTFGPTEKEPMKGIRKATASAMAKSWSTIPHVMHADLADITDLEAFREKHSTQAEEAGGKLTQTVFILKAMAAALREHPRFNASLSEDGDTLILKKYYHIGVAVETDDGLVVPVVREVDRKSPLELSAELVKIADRARSGDLSPEDMQGGTSTLTNVGSLGGRFFTPIIPHPQSVIVGAGEAYLEKVISGSVENPEENVRLLLPLCISFDHRVNDGADAARFAESIKGILEDPESLALAT